VSAPRAREIVIEKPIQQAVVILGALGPPAGSADHVACSLLASAVSGMGNRLFVELRDRKSLCYYTGVSYRASREAGMIAAYIGTSPDKVAIARAALRGELARVLDGGVTEEELRRARNAALGQWAIARQSCASESARAIRYESLGLGIEEIDRFEERITAVSREDVQRVARDWVALDATVEVTVRPAAVTA
jgi:zinc protease